MRYSRKLHFFAATALLGFASTASAGMIDFTNENPWKGANGQSTFTSGNVELSAVQVGDVITFNHMPASEPAGCAAGAAALGVALACNGDGLGISFGSPSDDEVTGSFNEKLIVDFKDGQGIAQQIILLDLFDEGDGEQAELRINYASSFETVTVNLSGLGDNDGGIHIIDLLGMGIETTGITSISFDAADDGGVSDFAVAGIVTPLPAALWLFGSALLGLAGFGRLRRRTAAAA